MEDDDDTPVMGIYLPVGPVELTWWHHLLIVCAGIIGALVVVTIIMNTWGWW